MPVVGAATHQTLSDLSVGKSDVLEEALGLRELDREASGLDPRSFALVKVAALIALGAPAASYAWQLGNAVADGVTVDDVKGVLLAVAPQVGLPKVILAASEIMAALDIEVAG